MQERKIKPIGDVLKSSKFLMILFLFSPMGRHIAKLNFEYIDKLKEKKSNLILVTAITPTPAGFRRENDNLCWFKRWFK